MRLKTTQAMWESDKERCVVQFEKIPVVCPVQSGNELWLLNSRSGNGHSFKKKEEDRLLSRVLALLLKDWIPSALSDSFAWNLLSKQPRGLLGHIRHQEVKTVEGHWRWRNRDQQQRASSYLRKWQEWHECPEHDPRVKSSLGRRSELQHLLHIVYWGLNHLPNTRDWRPGWIGTEGMRLERIE